MDVSPDMGATDSPRFLHQLLILKVRHVHRILACNVFPPDGQLQPKSPSPLPAFTPRRLSNSGYFFSLHCSEKSAAFLTSELRCSAHPNWEKIDLLNEIPQHLQTAKGFVVKVWLRNCVDVNASSCHNEIRSKEENNSDAKEFVSNCTDGGLAKNVNKIGNMAQLPQMTAPSPQLKEVLTRNSRHLRTASYSHSPDTIRNLTMIPKSSSLDPGPSENIDTVPSPTIPVPKGFCDNAVSPVLLFSWSVHLSGLVPVGKNLLEAAQRLAPNTLVFQLNGEMLYTAVENIIEPIPSLDPAQKEIYYNMHLPLSQTKRSYTPSVLTRLHQTERDVNILERKCEFSHESVEFDAKLTSNSEQELLRMKVAMARARLRVARELLRRERGAFQLMEMEVRRLDEENQAKAVDITSMVQSLARDKSLLRSVCTNALRQMKQLVKTRYQLALRRGHLIRDLAVVYPIVQIGPKDEFSISDIWIPDANLHSQNSLQTPNFQLNRSPNSAKNSAKDSPKNITGNLEQNSRVSINPAFHPVPHSLTTGLPFTHSALSAGLGMVTHLVCLVAKLLKVPLRYPMRSLCSFSNVTDIATSQLPNDNRDFPLYTRGKEREKLHFQYAVFLLNKNIAQLHHYCGLPKPHNPACTLPNLYSLLMHLIRDEQFLADELPDLKFDLLLTPFNDLLGDLSSLNPPETSSTHCSPSVSPTRHPPTDVGRTIHLQSYTSEPVYDGRLSSSFPYDQVGSCRTPEDSSTAEAQQKLCRSLDKGLDDITEGKDGVQQKNTGSKHAVPTIITKTSGSLTNLCERKSLMVVAGSIDFNDDSTLMMGSSGYDDTTTTLLRSWHENDPVHFTGGYGSVSSMEGLEEVGVEVTENFMPREEGQVVEEEEEDTVPSEPTAAEPKKVKKSFWPFSRSNTSESNKDVESANNDSALRVEDSGESQEGPVTSSSSNSSIVISPPVQSDSSNIPVPSLPPSTKSRSPETEELLIQSLAALSQEINCTPDDLSNLSELITSVSDRTERLASKSFSFKMGGAGGGK